MREWSIRIFVVGPNGEELPASIFDKVTYRLHPTFQNPTRSTAQSSYFPYSPCLMSQYSPMNGLEYRSMLRSRLVMAIMCIVIKRQPFKLEERGWGEFDMEVVLHGADKGGDHLIRHDLNFQKPKYEITHVIVCCYCDRIAPVLLLSSYTVCSIDLHESSAKPRESPSAVWACSWF